MVCAKEMELKAPDEDYNEELKATEQQWQAKGYILTAYLSEEERKITGFTNQLDQPCQFLVTFYSACVDSIISKSRRQPAATNAMEFFQRLHLEFSLNLTVELLKSVPFYLNENMTDYLQRKVPTLFNWAIETFNVGSGPTRPDFTDFPVPAVTRDVDVVVDDNSYMTLLFSSLTLGSLLNPNGKMSSVFDKTSDNPDTALEEFIIKLIYQFQHDISGLATNTVLVKVSKNHSKEQSHHQQFDLNNYIADITAAYGDLTCLIRGC